MWTGTAPHYTISPAMRARSALSVAFALSAVAFLAAQAPARRQVSLIITGGTVVTQDAARRVLSPGAIAVNGADIVAIDRPEVIAAGFRGAQTINARDQIVLPGLINTHGH